MNVVRGSIWGALLFLACPGFSQSGDFLSLQRRLVEIYRENQDAIVRVKGAYEKVDEDGQPVVELNIGTGFFISKDGHLLANATRTFGARRIWIEHRGIDYAAELIGSDTINNVSLLRLITMPPEFGVIRMGESTDLPEIGTMAVAISHYLDFEAAPSIGMVQNYARRYGNSIFPTTFLRVSISNDLGEGGAPILDLNGRLIGMLIAALPDIRASFALPGRAVMRIRDDLLFEGEVKYSWIGIEVDSNPDWESGRVRINKVIEGTPAAKAGILDGDILLQVGEFPILSVEDYPNASFFTRPGQFITVIVGRNGEQLTYTLRVEERPADEPLIVNNDPDNLPGPLTEPVRDPNAEPPADPSPRRPRPPEDTTPLPDNDGVGPPAPSNR